MHSRFCVENSFQFFQLFQCSQLNRYGNQTKSTGYLCVTNQIVVQRDVNVFNNKQSTGSRIEINKNRITIDDVVRAYQKAKRRLEDATQR